MNRKPHRIKVLECNETGFLVEVNEKVVRVRFRNAGQGKIAIIEVNGKSFQTSVERTQTGFIQVKIGGKIFEVQCQPKVTKETVVKLEPVTPIAKKPALGLAKEKGAVVAPIAGRIVLLKANVGQKIERGDCVCVLEAMKMQNEVSAVEAGFVKEIRVSEGAVVNKGDVLAVIS